MAGNIVDVAIVAGIPPVQVLVQAIEPISSGWQVDDLLAWNGMRNENGDRVADEHVTSLDIAPQEIPDLGLGATGLGNKVTTDLDVGSVKDRTIGCQFLDQGDEARHLRVVNLSRSVLVSGAPQMNK